jgi:hypothetical protein
MRLALTRFTSRRAPFALAAGLAFAALAPLPVAGCQVLNRIGGTATVDMSRATLRRMNVTLRNQEQAVCPREQVQMAVFMTGILEGEKEEKTFETWEGRGEVRKNDRLEFTDFTFTSEQGQFDKDGWFAPLQSLTASAGHEFAIHVTFNPSPLIFSTTYKFKPGYACITVASVAGKAGLSGGVGKEGALGKYGDGGGVMSAGGDGSDGSVGGVGADGTAGEAGSKVRAVATYVKTPFYDKLIAVRLTGAINDFVLVEPGHPFAIHVNGGPGGPGGVGGKGGKGGVGSQGNPGGRGGNGGNGGTGGRGGPGGAGGSIELVFDPRFPDLAAAIAVDVTGAPGGIGGHGGEAGESGAGGKGIAPANSPGGTSDGKKGREGMDGVVGAVGRPGANGTALVHPGPIGDAFAGLTDITVLTSLPPAHASR